MRNDKNRKVLCAECGEHRPGFCTRSNSRWRADREHDLCRRCFHALRDRLRALALRSEPAMAA